MKSAAALTFSRDTASTLPTTSSMSFGRYFSTWWRHQTLTKYSLQQRGVTSHCILGAATYAANPQHAQHGTVQACVLRSPTAGRRTPTPSLTLMVRQRPLAPQHLSPSRSLRPPPWLGCQRTPRKFRALRCVSQHPISCSVQSGGLVPTHKVSTECTNVGLVRDRQGSSDSLCAATDSRRISRSRESGCVALRCCWEARTL